MGLSELDLNLLVVLHAVLSERSVARAARRLHVTPSAISNGLARLRSALGDPLVTRSGRGIVPTPRASELGPLLARTLGEIERAVRRDAFDPSTTTRQFTVAIADGGQLTRIPRLARLLGQEMPNASLRVVGIDTFLSSGGLGGTEVDVAIAGLEPGPGIHAMLLSEERTVLVARRGHPRASGKMSKAELAALRHVEVQVAPGVGVRALTRSYAEIGVVREVAIVVPSFIAALAVVASTDYVATVPATLVTVLGDRLGVGALKAPAPRLTIPIRLAWHERTNDDPAMRFFRGVVARSGSWPDASRPVARGRRSPAPASGARAPA